jgi:ATP-binding cassette, subfamily C, bacterial
MVFFGDYSIGLLASFVRLFTGSVSRRQQISGLILVIGASLTEGVSISLLGPLVALMGERTSSAGPARNVAARLLYAVGLNLSLPLILAIFVSAVLCRAVFVRKRDMVTVDLRLSFIDAVRQRLYRAIQDAHWSFIARERQSHLVKALTTDIDSVAMGTNLFLQIPAVGMVSAVQLAIALSISPLLTLAAIGCGGLVAILVRWRRGDAFQAGKRILRAQRAIFNEISDFLASLKLAKSHNAEEHHRLAFEAAVAQQHDNIFAYSQRMADARMLVQIAAAIMLGAFVYAGSEYSHLSTPELVIMIVVFARLMPGLMQMQQSAASLWQMLPVFDDLHRLISRCDAAKESLISGGTERLPLRDRVRLSSIRFRYDKVRGPDVLAGLDLEIPAGSAVGIVGASGVGKSTLADMLMGLQVPDAGNVSVDGKTLTGLRLAAWRRSIAYIPQENFLFNQSIRANLQWAAPDASDADLRRVLALTGADAVVATMPEGLDTVVGERGNRLSGGERQRLILARALLREPTLLILDEATSALDHESEQAVWAVIDRLRGSTTVVVIAHRLSTLRSVDLIAVLDGGKIVQFGPFSALTNEGAGGVAVLLRAGAIREDATGINGNEAT